MLIYARLTQPPYRLKPLFQHCSKNLLE